MKLIPNAVSVKVAKSLLKTRSNSPSLLFGAGVTGMTISTVLACRSTLRLEAVIQKTEMDLSLAKQVRVDRPDEYSDQDLRKDTAVIWVRGAGSMVKLYAPALLLGSASVACLTKSHHILQERNLALTAAYAAVAEAFEKYRGKVVEKYGEDEDRHFRYENEEVRVVDEETGRTVSKIRVNPDEAPSQYARFFDPFSSEWSKEAEYNFTFLRAQQNWFNDLLKMKGYVMLNDVYERLGLTATSAGSVVGWVLDGEGDSYVDFGIFRGDQSAIDFVNGRENSILLDFNVDGIVYDKLDKISKRNQIGATAWQS